MAFNPTNRLEWIDTTKGIAIVLVVLGHCWIGLHGAGLIPDTALFETVRKSIYLFHMPLFFLVSGLMTARLPQLDLGRLLTSRIMLLVWPMVLWTYLMNAGKLAMGELANEPVTLDSFNWFPLPPQWQFWFLWALFLLHVSTWALSRLAKSGGVQPTAWHWGVVILALALVDTLGGSFGAVDPLIRSALLFGPFFFLGVALCHLEQLPRVNPAWLIAGFVVSQVCYHFFAPPLLVVMVLAAVAALSVMLLCQWLAEHLSLPRLAALGAASMAIYLAHTFFSAPIRAVLLKLDITALSLHVLFGTAIGIIGPLILLQIAKTLGLRRVLGF